MPKDGRTIFVIGGGPSVSDTDLSPIAESGCDVIGVNSSYKLGSFINYCWFGDYEWWLNETNLKEYSGFIAHCNERSDLFVGNRSFARSRSKPSGIETNPMQVAWNASSGGSAVNFAYHLGARKIVLVGYDMQTVCGRKNWHDEHPVPESVIRGNVYASEQAYLDDLYKRFRKPFKDIKKDAESMGINIINCTPGSALTEFPIMSLTEYFNEHGFRT